MARREYQDPPLKKSVGKTPFWYVRVYVKVLNGRNLISRKYHRERLGWCHDVGPREAAKRRSEYLKKINGQNYSVLSQVPFDEFAEIWRETHVKKEGNLGFATREKYEGQLDRHILPHFKKYRLCEIDTQVIDQFLGQKAEQGLSWWTRTDLRNILSSMFTKAIDWGYWPRDARSPVERVSAGKKRIVREKRILTDEQIRNLLAHLPPRIAFIVRFADSTGLRASEILGLRWGGVDLDSGWVTVSGRWYRGDYDETKSDSSARRIPLGCLVDELRSMKPPDANPSDYIFTRDDGSGEPLWDSGIRKALKITARSLGLDFPGFGMHSFRRESSTKLQELGASSIEAQKHLGHSKAGMTAEYTILQDNRHQDLVRKLQERLFADGQRPPPGDESREKKLIDRLEALLGRLEKGVETGAVTRDDAERLATEVIQ